MFSPKTTLFLWKIIRNAGKASTVVSNYKIRFTNINDLFNPNLRVDKINKKYILLSGHEEEFRH